VYPRLPRVVVPVAGAADSLRAAAGVAPERITVLPNPLDLRRGTAGAAEPLPAPLAPLFDAPTVVAVGRLTEQKGFDVLIAAHARLRAAGLEHRLLILGEGEGRAALEALALRLGVRDSVALPGFVANPYPMMKAARLFVLPSRLEGFGMVVAEALALGVPVVTTDCVAGPADLVGHGRYGVVVPVGDERALAEAMAGVLRDPARAAALAAAGPRRAAEFGPAVVAPQWERLLTSAAARPAVHSPRSARLDQPTTPR
jgi:glycosyltransferase involved in cell wall biosynthesis